MLAVEEYDAIWSAIRDRAGVLVAEGETDLSRVVRRLQREWCDMSLESKGGTAFGKVVVLPRAALLGARRDVIVHVLKSACNDRLGDPRSDRPQEAQRFDARRLAALSARASARLRTPVLSDDRRRTIDTYEGKWAGVRDYAAGLVAAGERDLSRATRLVEAEERELSLDPLDGMALRTPITLPRAAMTGARRDLIQRILLDGCTPETRLVVELGSGGGMNLLNLHLWGGPRVPYCALEPTESGRACTEILAALDPGLDLTTASFDFEQPDYDVLPRVDAHVLVFTVHSIEQVTELPREVITGLFDLGASVTGVHFEPVGWQILDEPDRSSHEYALRQRYNRNLWALLQELEAGGEVTVDTVVPDLFGDKYKNPGTLIVWNTPAG